MADPRKQSRQVAQRRDHRRRELIDQRRQTAGKRGVQAVAAAHRRRRRRRQVLIGSGAVVAVVVAVVVVVRWQSGSDGSGPSAALSATLVPGATGALAIADVPTAYTVTYQVQSFSSGSDPAVATEDFKILRPFDASIVSKSGAPPGGAEQWSVTTKIGLYEQSTSGKDPEANVFAPTTAPGDYRLDASLADLVADGNYVLGDRRTLLGRECQVYRTGSPLESYDVTAPTDTDYADVCIDGSGLVLEELTVASGAVTVHQVATAVDAAATLTDTDFPITATPTKADAGGSDLDQIDATVAPVDGYWSFAQPPTGYTLTNRYRLRENITDPNADTTDTTEAAPTVVVESYVDVYADGNDTIVVRQGPSSVDPGIDSSSSKDVDTTSLGSVKTASGVSGSVISVTPDSPADWFVQVSATIPRADLLATVEQLSNG